MKPVRSTAAAVLTAASLLVAPSLAAELAGTNRIDLQRHDLSIPGREVIQVLVEFAPGAAAPRHSHHGEEIVHVVEGVLEYQLDGRSPVTVKAGEVLFEMCTRSGISVPARRRSLQPTSWKRARPWSG